MQNSNSKDSSKVRIRPISVPPKKPMTAFMLYSMEVRPSIVKMQPELKFTEIPKVIGEKWQTLPSANKDKYQKLFEQDKLRYEKEKQQFDKQGFFTFLSGPNKGKKSSELSMSTKDFPKDTVLPKKPRTARLLYISSKKGSGKSLHELSDEYEKLTAK